MDSSGCLKSTLSYRLLTHWYSIFHAQLAVCGIERRSVPAFLFGLQARHNRYRVAADLRSDGRAADFQHFVDGARVFAAGAHRRTIAAPHQARAIPTDLIEGVWFA